MNEIEILAMKKEIEKAERELYIKRMELCSLETSKEFNDEMDFIEEEKELADYYAKSKAKRGNRRKATFNVKRKKSALAKGIYGDFYDELKASGFSDADLLSKAHNNRNEDWFGNRGYKRTRRNRHEKKTEFAKEVPSLEYVPYKAEPSELAIKLYEFAREFDAYECMDTGYTIEKAEEDLQNPYVLIESLINIARKMMM